MKNAKSIGSHEDIYMYSCVQHYICVLKIIPLGAYGEKIKFKIKK